MQFRKLILTYGTLCTNHGNNRLLQNPHSSFLGEFKTEPKYTLFDGGFPIVERGGNTSIHCQVWEIKDEKVMNNVHSLEGCTGIAGHKNNWYDLDENIETPYGKASMYVMDKGKSRREVKVESGKWY